jgi:hypothetical protein
MNDTNPGIVKLQRIQKLWVEFGRTGLRTPEYETITERIRVLSAEYQSLIDASPKPGKSK